jgi:ElaB/YqjD/DUF883 family membrane-anchored ribosome-binding protein
MTSFIAENLNLPGIPLEISLKIKNKYEFRNLCEKCGINSAKTFLIESGERFKYCETNQNKEKFVEIRKICETAGEVLERAGEVSKKFLETAGKVSEKCGEIFSEMRQKFLRITMTEVSQKSDRIIQK